MSDVVASGTVRVRDLHSGAEWDEIVEVFESDMEWYEERGFERTVEDVARNQANRQSDPARTETLEVDLA